MPDPDPTRKVESKFSETILPADFKIPELSDTQEGGFVEKTQSFKFRYKGQEFNGEIAYERDERRTSQIEITFYSESKEIVKFAARYFNDRGWNLYNRKVDNTNDRKQGFGTLAFKTIEEIIILFKNKFRDQRSDYIHTETQIPALLRMMIDQDWLEQRGLEEYQRADGFNLGYFPTDYQEESVKELLDLSKDGRYTDSSQCHEFPKVALHKTLT
ncbi:MAG: hypothetical protein ABID45_03860 [Patescibacteria group bacterium]